MLDVGRADAIADNVIGPAYIAAAALLHSVFGLSPEDSLVTLTRGSYALGRGGHGACSRVAARSGFSSTIRVTRRSARLRCAHLLGRDSGTGRMFRGATSSRRSLAVTLYAVRFAPSRLTVVHAGAIGVVLAMLAS